MSAGTGAQPHGRAGERGARRLRVSMRLCLCALLLQGCAYYNGMYNAKRWSRAAESSERAGRTSEARERWQRASLHAESLVARHPRSRWADDAMLVRGRAALHLELHTEAAILLALAARQAGDPEQRLEALLLLGRAELALKRYSEARSALDSAARSSSRERRAEALLYRGRTLLAMGAAVDALADLRVSTHPKARFERARAALALRDTVLANATFDSLAAEQTYVERDWLPALDSLAAAGAPRKAAELVDALVRRPDLGRGDRARLLLADGGRAIEMADDAAAAARFDAVLALVPDSGEAQVAGVRLVRIDLRAARTEEEVAAAHERLAALQQRGGAGAREAQPVVRLLDKIDSLGRAVVSPDAFWFLRAEVMRDSLRAPQLAAAAFAAMAERFPESPWTPKGVVAAIAAGHPDGDALRDLLRERYAASPYAVVAQGGDAERYAVLEDSLQRALEHRPPTGRDAGIAPGANPAAEPDDEEERVGGRRPPAPAQQRPPPRPATPPRPRPGAQPTP
ncbi:MAG: hypothetical protein HYR48_06555 [Gemmatimonadetes bacterium]|nr:hypothetical protein [Gemmatimonadota bacterium]